MFITDTASDKRSSTAKHPVGTEPTRRACGITCHEHHHLQSLPRCSRKRTRCPYAVARTCPEHHRCPRVPGAKIASRLDLKHYQQVGAR